jgi:hypothetical protein
LSAEFHSAIFSSVEIGMVGAKSVSAFGCGPCTVHENPAEPAEAGRYPLGQLTPEHVEQIARISNVKSADVIEADLRQARDYGLNVPLSAKSSWPTLSPG